MKKILIGGSPCTYWSIAQQNNRETTATGQGWELFKNYLIAKEKFKPDFFLYENNKSAAPAIKEQISRELGVDLMFINSALVSAQKRERFYAFNWHAEQPENRGIILKDILEWSANEKQDELLLPSEKPELICAWGKYAYGKTSQGQRCYGTNGKACTIRSTGSEKIIEPISNKNIIEDSNYAGMPIFEANNGFVTIKGERYPIRAKDGLYIIRKLTPIECERLQTLPDDYTAAANTSKRYKALGNGWTAEVIIHLLREGLKEVSRNEEIVVLSMYDGIATGRYCLEKLGFKNIKYFAYEIDKSAIEIALDNFPDIIQMGDAFQVRSDNWKLDL